MIECMSGPAETVEWPTPQNFFDVVDAEFRFSTDVCSTHENAKCEHHYTLQENGLAQRWTGMCWMNPPHGSEISRWLAKAHQSAQEGDCTVVCLIPARTDTSWFHKFARFAEIRFLRGRLTFVGSENGAPFPSMLMIFHAYCDPAGIMRIWEWKATSQEVLQF